jgi:Mg-chelatase subunit ChlD
MKAKVVVSFESESEAEEFRRALQKIKDKGGSPLYNAIMVSVLAKAKEIKAKLGC